MATYLEISGFLEGVERRAYKYALYAVQNQETALDIVQDAMIKLTEKYSDKPIQELSPLFQKILQNTIYDYFRYTKTQAGRTLTFSNLENQEESEPQDFLETLESKAFSSIAPNPEKQLEQTELIDIIEQAIKILPPRQREAFLLRYWEEMDISETAEIMGCSEGSVKTHCFRATQALMDFLRVRGITL